MAYIKINDVKDLENGIQSPILKFLNNQTISKIIKTLEVKTDDILLYLKLSAYIVKLLLEVTLPPFGASNKLPSSKINIYSESKINSSATIDLTKVKLKMKKIKKKFVLFIINPH